MLNKNDILKKSALKTKKVFVSQWDGEVLITELTVAESDEIQSIILGGKSIGNTEKMEISIEQYQKSKKLNIAYGVVNEDGSKMFSLEEIEKMPNNDVLDFLNEQITEHNRPKK